MEVEIKDPIVWMVLIFFPLKTFEVRWVPKTNNIDIEAVRSEK